MADKAISELVSAEQITATDMFVLEQNGTAKKLTGQVLLNWLTAAADGHGGIQSWVPLKTVGLVTTYRITLADQTHIDIDVVDGRGIKSLKPTSTNGLEVTYTVTYNDDTIDTFTVTNGAKGDKGDDIYPWIKYASQKPTEDSHSFGDVPDVWIGLYFGTQSTAPTDWQQYTWYQWKGEKGDTGDPATLVSSSVTYQVGDSGTVIPSGTWSTTIPMVSQGRYLWTREITQFNTGSPITKYSVARFGIDGSGAVSSVAGVSPDANGNVALDAASVKALALAGGTMEGGIHMNGQTLDGLNAPTANDQAANMGFVNAQVKKAAPWNLLDNSDFTRFIAQAGIGGNHGTQAYAGDRWILDSGSVTGTANENGSGYSGVTLNGTIRQILENPPAAGTAAIEMVSGTAEVTYANGEVTVTSSGGVIKNVALYEGAYTAETLPKYQPKGYGVELAECQRYFYIMEMGYVPVGYGYANGATQIRIAVPLHAQFRKKPSIFYSDNKSISDIYLSGNGARINPTAVTVSRHDSGASFMFTVSEASADHAYIMRATSGFSIYLSADL